MMKIARTDSTSSTRKTSSGNFLPVDICINEIFPHFRKSTGLLYLREVHSQWQSMIENYLRKESRGITLHKPPRQDIARYPEKDLEHLLKLFKQIHFDFASDYSEKGFPDQQILQTLATHLRQDQGLALTLPKYAKVKEYLGHLGRRIPLTKLTILYNKQLADEDLEAIGQHGAHLESLVIAGSNNSVENLAALGFLPSLKEFALSDFTCQPDELRHFAEHYPALQSLRLENTPGLDFRASLPPLLSLRSLELISPSSIWAGIDGLSAWCPHLENFTLLEGPNTPHNLDFFLRGATKLQRLFLFLQAARNRDLASISTSASTLRELSIVTADDALNDLGALEDLPSLDKLTLRLPGISNGALKKISQHCPNLRTLKLAGCTRLSSLDYLEELKSLTKICFINTDIKEESLDNYVDKYTPSTYKLTYLDQYP